ncbi:hypothetical protein [Thorsellia anophelis]|uniref:Uncharacterized protein n=1 Tax=Thorsellia anophelis DSM 18579 TaxID=1123402 RepID=A0A1I0FIL3_9GAMM|nr:hypothetical protein [Thorsellia anophelis]SET57874.1 hypothetical protein SAMN02583745_02776 [Thorsellia anophelis DSM 18579]
MKKHIWIKSAITSFILVVLPLSVNAAQIYDSEITTPINGYRPYLPSVGPYLYQQANPDVIYKAIENDGQKVQVKAGDTLRVPTYLIDDAYSVYYTWADLDSTNTASDIEDKEQINLTFEWYLLEANSTEIKPGENATLLTSDDGVVNDDGEIGPSYTVGLNAVGSQIGFRIKAWSERGLPKEGVYLDVPNIAYLGKQTSPVDPSLPPVTKVPEPGLEEDKHPDIEDKVVGMDNEFIVKIYDITDGEEKAVLLEEDTPIYVTRTYKASVEKWDAVSLDYVDKTAEYEDFLTWSLYEVQDSNETTPVYEFMTANGMINNIPTEAKALKAFSPLETPFTYDAVDLAEIKAKFIKGDNTVFKLQDTNQDALPQAATLAPNFSEQSLQLKVRLVLP